MAPFLFLVDDTNPIEAWRELQRGTGYILAVQLPRATCHFSGAGDRLELRSLGYGFT
jgi:hypothetical protein